MKPLSHDRLYYFLPMWDDKPCLYIRALQPDHRRRMYASNAMAKIVDKLEESLHEVHNMLECDCDDADVKLKETFETLYHQCSNFSLLCSTPNTGLSMTGKTRLDKERLTQCQRELVGYFFSRKSSSRVANVRVSVCLSKSKTPLTSDIRSVRPSINYPNPSASQMPICFRNF